MASPQPVAGAGVDVAAAAANKTSKRPMKKYADWGRKLRKQERREQLPGVAEMSTRSVVGDEQNQEAARLRLPSNSNCNSISIATKNSSTGMRVLANMSATSESVERLAALVPGDAVDLETAVQIQMELDALDSLWSDTTSATASSGSVAVTTTASPVTLTEALTVERLREVYDAMEVLLGDSCTVSKLDWGKVAALLQSRNAVNEALQTGNGQTGKVVEKPKVVDEIENRLGSSKKADGRGDQHAAADVEMVDAADVGGGLFPHSSAGTGRENGGTAVFACGSCGPVNNPQQSSPVARACALRWQLEGDPTIKQSEFSAEEDKILENVVRDHCARREAVVADFQKLVGSRGGAATLLLDRIAEFALEEELEMVGCSYPSNKVNYFDDSSDEEDGDNVAEVLRRNVAAKGRGPRLHVLLGNVLECFQRQDWVDCMLSFHEKTAARKEKRVKKLYRNLLSDIGEAEKDNADLVNNPSCRRAKLAKLEERVGRLMSNFEFDKQELEKVEQRTWMQLRDRCGRKYCEELLLAQKAAAAGATDRKEEENRELDIENSKSDPFSSAIVAHNHNSSKISELQEQEQRVHSTSDATLLAWYREAEAFLTGLDESADAAECGADQGGATMKRCCNLMRRRHGMLVSEGEKEGNSRKGKRPEYQILGYPSYKHLREKLAALLGVEHVVSSSKEEGNGNGESTTPGAKEIGKEEADTKGKKWTAAEDAELRRYCLDPEFLRVETCPGRLKNYGGEGVGEVRVPKWKLIAAKLPGCTGPQCRERWMRSRAFVAAERGKVKKGKYSAAEDEELKKLLTSTPELFGQWEEIGRVMGGRSGASVRRRCETMFAGTLKLLQAGGAMMGEVAVAGLAEALRKEIEKPTSAKRRYGRKKGQADLLIAECASGLKKKGRAARSMKKVMKKQGKKTMKKTAGKNAGKRGKKNKKTSEKVVAKESTTGKRTSENIFVAAEDQK
eukprot:g8138.t1